MGYGLHRLLNPHSQDAALAVRGWGSLNGSEVSLALGARQLTSWGGGERQSVKLKQTQLVWTP